MRAKREAIAWEYANSYLNKLGRIAARGIFDAIGTLKGEGEKERRRFDYG
jgi:hypothetical protein